MTVQKILNDMKKRMIDTKFWSDSWIVNLDPIEKLLYLYLLTNERTNICGIYELPLKYMAIETGIEKEIIEKVLTRFEKDKKIYYVNGWIIIRNFIKHQNQKSPQVQIGIKAEFSRIPKEITDKIDDMDMVLYGIDTVSHSINTASKDEKAYGMDTQSHLNLNLNSNPNLNLRGGTSSRGEDAGDSTPSKKIGRTKDQEIGNKKSSPAENPNPDPVNEVMTVFYEHNPAIKFANKTMRRDVEFFIDKIGLKKTLELAKFAIGIQGEEYAPTIDNPTDMRSKYNALKRHYERRNLPKKVEYGGVAII